MDALSKTALTGVVKFQAFLALVLFLPAWTLRYWQGWAYWALYGLSILAITLYFLKKDRHLIAGRLQAGPGAESDPKQKVIQGITSLLLCAMLVLSSLGYRLRWASVSMVAALIGDAAVLAGFAWIFWVFQVNSFTFATVKIEPGQKVVTNGPYAIVRHPMYLGASVIFLATPIALGSAWGLALAGSLCGALVWRLVDEERFLMQSLAGYEEYRHQVRSRLVPFIW